MSRQSTRRLFRKGTPKSKRVDFGATWAFVAVLLTTSATAQETRYHWLNQELKSKGTAQEIYVAIGKGDLAECTADARQATQRSSSMQDCSQLSSNGNPFLFQDCNERNNASGRNAEYLHRNLVFGCMAKRGWLWIKLQ